MRLAKVLKCVVNILQTGGIATTPSRQIFSLLACSAERVGGANVTWDILLSISTGESMAVHTYTEKLVSDQGMVIQIGRCNYPFNVKKASGLI